MRWRCRSAVVFLSVVGLSVPAVAETDGPEVIEATFVGESAPLTDLASADAAAPQAFAQGPVEGRVIPNMRDFGPLLGRPLPTEMSRAAAGAAGDALRQHETYGPAAPRPTLSFDAVSDDDNSAALGFRIVPPDTNGDVGREYFVQSINGLLEIYEKKTGASVLGPVPNNIFFAGTGVACDIYNDGDPVVLYDHLAKRWIFTQFALFDDDPNQPGTFVSLECFAVSTSSDPLGSYYLYQFPVSPAHLDLGSVAGFNDYPKVTVWPDGYYGTFNDFQYIGGGFQFAGVDVVAFDKKAMMRGEAATGIKFFLPRPTDPPFAPFHFSLQPGHFEGSTEYLGRRHTPPNVFVQAFDDETWGVGPDDGDGPDGYWHWEFDADFRHPSNSTFTDLGLIQSENFDSFLCDFEPCVPQPAPAGPADVLDTLSQFTMYRTQYRAFKRHKTLLVSHSVDVDGADTAGVRWAELRKRRYGGWKLYQAGTFSPDEDNRWMPSIAMDRRGNIALGYSVSSESTYPSVRYTGRKAEDRKGKMRREQSCVEGTGVQLGSSNRWGDYASVSIDPVDGCTFWYTNEYYETTGTFDFNTRVCSFNFDDCKARGGDGGHRDGGHHRRGGRRD